MTLGERLKLARECADLKQTEVKAKTGINNKTLSNWEHNIANPAPQDLKILAELYGVSADYLLGGEGKLVDTSHDTSRNVTNTSLTPKPISGSKKEIPVNTKDKAQGIVTTPAFVPIPLLGSVAVGDPIPAVEEWTGNIVYVRKEQIRDGEQVYALHIKGDSTYPDIQDGDIVIVRQQEDVDSGQIAIVLVDGEEATCKQVIKREDGLELVGFNRAAFPPRKFTYEETEEMPVRIIGRVMESRREY